MSIAMLERAAWELAPFLDEVAFLGGATVALWITDPAAPELDTVDGTIVRFGRGRPGGRGRVDDIVLPRLRVLAGQ